MEKKIRKATVKDISRIAEILIFTKRMNYRQIFQNDKVSFGEMQVLPLAEEYRENPEKLEHVWVYEDAFVKGMLHMKQREIQELYVEHFFQRQGIGGALLDFAVQKGKASFLWVLEKNQHAIDFYQRHGFVPSGERMLEEGTEEYIIRMENDNFLTVPYLY